MRRSRPTILALAATAACLGSAAPDEGRPVKILARGAWPHMPTQAAAGKGTDRAARHWVIRSPQGLADAAGRVAASARVPEAFRAGPIDFDRRMILAVMDGAQPLVGTSGGGPPSAPYSVSIARVLRDEAGETITVQWRRVRRGKDQGVLTSPLEAVLVDRFDGTVRFEQLPSADQDGAPLPPPGPGRKEVPARARAFWPGGWPPEAPATEWFVRDREALLPRGLRAPEPVLERMRQEALARYTRALGVADIDFTRQMVVGVSAGAQPSGTRVEITGVEADARGDSITVRWTTRPPAAAPRGVANPAEVVLLERVPGPVRFERAPPKEDP